MALWSHSFAQVATFWKKAERVVSYKVYVAVEQRKRAVLDAHLDLIVGQTEAYSKMLAQNLAGNDNSEAAPPLVKPATPAAIEIATPPAAEAAVADGDAFEAAGRQTEGMCQHVSDSSKPPQEDVAGAGVKSGLPPRPPQVGSKRSRSSLQAVVATHEAPSSAIAAAGAEGHTTAAASSSRAGVVDAVLMSGDADESVAVLGGALVSDDEPDAASGDDVMEDVAADGDDKDRLGGSCCGSWLSSVTWYCSDIISEYVAAAHQHSGSQAQGVCISVYMHSILGHCGA